MRQPGYGIGMTFASRGWIATFNAGSDVMAKIVTRSDLHVRRPLMAEILRSTTIVVMGLTVIGAGVFVVLYG